MSFIDFINSLWLSITSIMFGREPEEELEDMQSRFVHTVARCKKYPGDGPNRFPVDDSHVPWSVPFPEYKPVFYEAPVLATGPVWADDPKKLESIKFNTIDGSTKIDRTSAHGPYTISQDGYPLNPMGRTGIIGRGLLGRFGPNHAADPVVTRWKRDPNTHAIVAGADGNPVLQFVAVQRKDCGLWALPGGMVDAGEVASATVKREFGEEALNALELPPEKEEDLKNQLDTMFDPSKATVVYKGYVDDPRNTDNAWMETTAVSIHDSDGSLFDNFQLQGGDDASKAEWADFHPGMELYASHTKFMNIAYEFRKKEVVM